MNQKSILVLLLTSAFTHFSYAESPCSNPASVCLLNTEITRVISMITPPPTPPTVYSVGDLALGGVVFWVDASGTHGLVAQLTDVSSSSEWDTNPPRSMGTVSDGVGVGAANTASIVGQIGADAVAASDCENSTVGSQNDWYLPTKTELSLLYQQFVAGVVGGFTSPDYWSSTEPDGTTVLSSAPTRAILINFSIQGTSTWGLKSLPFAVRCIRSF